MPKESLLAQSIREHEEDIHVAIKSYNRPDGVSTIEIAPFAKIWVPETQAEAYRNNYGLEAIISIDPALDGNCAKKNNAILNYSDCKRTLILDDDINRICYFEDGDRIGMDPDSFKAMIEHHFRLAEDAGVKLWGINQTSDPMAYRTMTPFSFLAPILGPFNGHIDPDLRYDERVFLKEDYDFWLQNIQKYRRTLRSNKYHYFHAHGFGKAGGLSETRSMDLEHEHADRMVKKWGKKHFRPKGAIGGRSATGDNILNSLAKAGIPGT